MRGALVWKQTISTLPDNFTGANTTADFGIAQPRDAASLTRTGHVLGTEAFIAPEVMNGEPATEPVEPGPAQPACHSQTEQPCGKVEQSTHVPATQQLRRPERCRSEAPVLRLAPESLWALIHCCFVF